MRLPAGHFVRLSSRRYPDLILQRSVSLQRKPLPSFRNSHQHPAFRYPSQAKVATPASFSPYVLLLLVLGGGVAVYEGLKSNSHHPSTTAGTTHVKRSPTVEKLPTIEDSRMPAYDEMPIPEGSLGNLSAEQEAKLRQLWASIFKTFHVTDAEHPQGAVAEPHATSAAAHDSAEKKKKKRTSFFSRTKADDEATSAADDDKYGQTVELQEILRTQSPETLRETFWEMLKCEHPDACVLRFLRARKWDIDKALAMLVSTVDWRRRQARIDEEVMFQGEGGALADSRSSDPAKAKEGNDFLTQLRMGKSFIHGADKDGRPVTYVRVRLHHGGEQSESSMERYTIHVIETARLTLRPPVETGCIVFDMTNFTLANMDYTPVKFMIKVFEANYPESLGAVLVHKAPWIFQGIWRIIRGWLDPVVAGKIHFTNSAEDMDEYIPRNQLIKELGGREDLDYHYVEPTEGENAAQKDIEGKKKAVDERKHLISEYQTRILRWIVAGDSKDESDKLWAERNSLAAKLYDNYWQLDKHVRARSLYDRVGMIQKDGKIDFYPKHTLKVDNIPSSMTADTNGTPS